MDREKSVAEVLDRPVPPYKRCCIAIIPAKVVSQRLREKNFIEVNGTPMTIWTLWKAIQCPHIDHVVVSTDDIDVLLEKLPQLDNPVFSQCIVVARGPEVRHPNVALYWVIRDALKMVTSGGYVQDDPTHVVLMQPNVPTIPQAIIDRLVKAVVEERYNVARHYNLEGAETGGCDAYKIQALMEAPIMDADNFARWSVDPEVHTLEDLSLVDRIFFTRQEGKLDEQIQGQ